MLRDCWRKPLERYNGLEVHCAPGVHAAAADLLARYGVSRQGVLDLGAGSGAFLARLRDQGYTDLHAVERDAGRFALDGIAPISLDLDRPFAQQIGRQFGLVTAIEIIEHLESPIGFLREAASLLSPGGHLLVSSPNIAHWRSRLKFLLKGELRYFDEAQYRYQRHISPILPTLLPHLLHEANLQLVTQTTAGTFDGPLRRLLQFPLQPNRAKSGECLLFLARGAEGGSRSDRASRGAVSALREEVC